jgi:hypothetical protein
MGPCLAVAGIYPEQGRRAGDASSFRAQSRNLSNFKSVSPACLAILNLNFRALLPLWLYLFIDFSGQMQAFFI